MSQPTTARATCQQLPIRFIAESRRMFLVPRTPRHPEWQALVYTSITQRASIPHPDRVSELHLYKTSVRLIRPAFTDHKFKLPPDRTGTQLQGFSDKSKSRLRFTAVNSGDIIKSQFGMTYGTDYPKNGKLLKAHLNRFLTDLRRHYPDLHYIWIAEFQDRGAPHFHIFTNIAVTPDNHTTLATIWHRIAGLSQVEHLKVQSHPDNFINWSMGNGAYLCKYLDKSRQKSIPPVYECFGRFWGNSQSLKPRIIETISKDEIKLFSPQPKSWEYLVRHVCKYHEHLNPRSNPRTTPQSRLLMTAAPITRKLYDYLQSRPRVRTRQQPPEPQPF